MKNSPWPVNDMAAAALSAYVPAPMMGESPTLPGIFPVMPPVDVPAARFLAVQRHGGQLRRVVREMPAPREESQGR